MVDPTPVPEKTSSSPSPRVPDSQEPPEALQADHEHRTVGSKQDVTQEGTETGPKAAVLSV